MNPARRVFSALALAAVLACEPVVDPEVSDAVLATSSSFAGCSSGWGAVTLARERGRGAREARGGVGGVGGLFMLEVAREL